MLPIVLFFTLCIVNIINGCIPTQQVEDPALPCQVCPKVYDTSCIGYVAGQPWCVPFSSIGVNYQIGADPLLNFGDDETCFVYFDCPVGATMVADAYGVTVPNNVYYTEVMAQCAETGPDAGNWYFGLTGITPWTPIPLRSVKCVG